MHTPAPEEKSSSRIVLPGPGLSGSATRTGRTPAAQARAPAGPPPREPLRARLFRWCRRNPLASVALVLLALLLAASLALNVWAGFRATEASATTRRLGHRLYVADVRLAQRAWEDNRITRLNQLLDDQEPGNTEGRDLRGFEHYYLRHLCAADLETLPGAGQAVEGLAFRDDGRRLLAVGQDTLARTWDPGAGADQVTLQGVSLIYHAAVSPDGQVLAAVSGTDGMVKFWDATGAQSRLTLQKPNAGVTCLAFHPRAPEIAAGTGDGKVRVWDLATGALRSTAEGHQGPVQAVAYSPDGKTLASGGEDGTLRTWDAVTGKALRTFPGAAGPVLTVAWSADGHRLAGAGKDGPVTVWDVSSGKDVPALRGLGGAVKSLCFSPDGRRLATGGDDARLRVWDAGTGRELLELKGHAAPVLRVCFSPDGRRLASGDGTGTLKIWDASARPGDVVLRSNGQSSLCLAFDPQGRRLAAGYIDGMVKVWDTATGLECQTLQVPQVPVRCVCFSPDGRRLAVAYLNHGTGRNAYDSQVRVYDAAGGHLTLVLKGHGGPVRSVTFSPDGLRLATSSFDQTVRVWDAVTGQEIMSLRGHTGQVDCALYTPDGRQLVSAGFDGTIRVWDAATGRQLAALQHGTGGQRPRVPRLALGPDGRLLASVGEDRRVKVWDLPKETLLRTLEGHTDRVFGVSFSPDGRRLATASDDGTVRLWDPANDQETLVFQGPARGGNGLGQPNGFISVEFSADGGRLAASDWKGDVWLWDARPMTDALRLDREVLSVVRFWFARHPSGAEARAAIERDPALADAVRQKALELADTYAGELVHQEAARLVAEHYARTLVIAEVVKAVQQNPSLREEVRQEALALAEGLGEDVLLLNNQSWTVAGRPGLPRDKYELAVSQAEAACRLSPGDAYIVNTLGVAQFRAGLYREAVATLERSMEMNQTPGQTPFPEDLAFLAMAHFHLGQTNRAREELTRLKRLVFHSNRSYGTRSEARNFLQEVETLLAPPALGAATAGLMLSPLGQGPWLAASGFIPGRITLLDAAGAKR